MPLSGETSSHCALQELMAKSWLHSITAVNCQKDIRQIQLAVSAIASGIQILLKHARLEISDIDKVYISGSFGKSLKLETIKTIGILPTALADASIIEFTGNTSLLGAIHSAIHGTIPDNYASLIKRCTEIELANDSDFNVIFINNL